MKNPFLTIFICFLFLASCEGPFDKASMNSKLNGLKNDYAKADFNSNKQLDISSIAFIRPLHHIRNSENVLDCDGYCLRLLYSGASKIVLVGTFENGKNNEWPDKKIDPTKEAALIQSAKVKSFHIEKSENCAPIKYNEARDFKTNPNGSEKPTSIEAAVAYRIAAGECLVAQDANITDARTIIKFDNYYDSSFKGRNIVDLSRISAFAFNNNNQLFQVFRKTKIDFKARMTFVPDGWENLGGKSYIETSSDSRRLHEIIAQDLGIEFSEIKADELGNDENLRASVKKLIANNNRLQDGEKAIFKLYFDEIEKSNALSEEDKENLKAIITRPSMLGALYPMSQMAINKKKEMDFSFLAPTMLAELDKSIAKVDALGNPKAWSSGSEIGDLKDLQSGIGNLFEALPDKAIVQNGDKLLEIAPRLDKSYGSYQITKRLYLLPYSRTEAILKAYLQDPNGENQNFAYYSICKYGEEAKSLSPQLISAFNSKKGERENGRLLAALFATDAYQQIPQSEFSEWGNNMLNLYKESKAKGRDICGN